MKSINRSAITVYGTEEFLAWVKSHHKNLHRWTLQSINHNPNVYLVDKEDQNCWGDFFESNFDAIFRTEVGEYINNGVEWPKCIDLELFRSWFRCEYTEVVYDLSADEIDRYDE